MQQNEEEHQKVWAKIIAKAWSDPEFKDRLLKDPKSVFESQGIEVPTGMRLVVNENTKNTCYMTLPEKSEGELSEEKLQSIAAGYYSHAGSIL